jgi:branched-chain amino acid transport system substrate-binding protein
VQKKREERRIMESNLLKYASFAGVVATIFLVGRAQAESPKYPWVTDNEIKIGQTMPYSGPASTFGTTGRTEAAYFDMVNAQGGVNGRKIRFLSLDDGFSPEKAVELTRKLVEQEQVALVFGTVGSAINTSIQKYLTLGHVPQLLVGAGGNRFDDPERYPWTTSFAPKVSIESRILANYVLTNNPAAKIAVLYQNDEFGKDELAGFRMALGDRADRMVIKELSYEITDPTVDTQIIELQASGADTFFLIGFQRAASQALGKAYDLGWRPQRIVAYAASSAATAMKNAAEKVRGVISVHFLKDPTDKRWRDDAGYLQWRAFMKGWYPDGGLDDIFVVSAYTQAQLLTYVLKQCGNDLSRENIMKQSTSIKDLELPMLLPGIKINTSPTQFSAVDQMELVRFDGESWLPLISAEHDK